MPIYLVQKLISNSMTIFATVLGENEDGIRIYWIITIVCLNYGNLEQVTLWLTHEVLVGEYISIILVLECNYTYHEHRQQNYLCQLELHKLFLIKFVGN